MEQQSTEPKKRRRPLVVVGIAAGVLVGLCLCLAVLGAFLPNSDTNTTEVPAAAEPAQRAEEVAVATVPPASADLTEPTDIPEPTNTPKPTDTPQPTNTPRPTNTPVPTATPTPAPEPIIISGQGDSVVDIEKWSGIALARIRYRGDGNFAVLNYGVDGERYDLLVNVIGSYDGTRPIDFLDNQQTGRFEIQSDGSWEIEIVPFSEVRVVDIPATFDGVGDDVVLLRSASGRPDLLKIDNTSSSSNFAIWAYGNGRDLLVNEIAPYSGTVMVDRNLPTTDGLLALVIVAEGSWSIDATTR